MTSPSRSAVVGSWAWALLLVALIGLRIPSLAQPAGGDQSLYAYVADRIAVGDVPYRDAFEQKPPGIFYVYALVGSVLPRAALVPGADLAASALTALLLVVLGRRLFGSHSGFMAATLYLLLGDPGLQRLGGLHVRAQCETFIGLAVTVALVLAWRERTRPDPPTLALAGALVGCAFWLKYNALAFALPVAAAAVLAAGRPLSRRRPFSVGIWLALGGTVVVAVGTAGFALAGALPDLWLGTVAYNLTYSGETYRNFAHVVSYPFTMPVTRARVDGLWFIGLLGAALLVWKQRDRGAIVSVAWVAAAVLSIALNGARGLPQYFVQAAPALALAGAAGLQAAWRVRTTTRVPLAAAVALVVAGLWRVGAEPAARWEPRLFGLTQAWRQMDGDRRALDGETPRDHYLRQFAGAKYEPVAVERLARFITSTTLDGEPVYVFGFASGAVLTAAKRPSASRFFWSRPVVLEFAADRVGFGTFGLMADLHDDSPPIVALQKHDWGLAEPNVPDSEAFFLSSPVLGPWLREHYTLAYEDDAFSVWRRVR
jgi:hypothetical protein